MKDYDLEKRMRAVVARLVRDQNMGDTDEELEIHEAVHGIVESVTAALDEQLELLDGEPLDRLLPPRAWWKPLVAEACAPLVARAADYRKREEEDEEE